MSVLEENWDLNLDLNSVEKRNIEQFELSLSYVNEKVSKILENGFRSQNQFLNGNAHLCYDDELKALMEKNKLLRYEVDYKLDELSKQQTRYESCKKDQKLLSEEIKERHEAFLMAKKSYKKFLKLYHTVENKNNDRQTIFVQFFTETKKESENYSVRLLKDLKTGKYHLINTIPKLPNEKELQRILGETNDVPGALCCIREEFLMIKSSKK
ncbi:hypothetical protein K1T71_007224 [Dendrolimus kikuchii]|uniref:Uncharacterized protein n=1 Tax=Dendrolimus kikuchii TaxID=765133 RepID=A0ACC1D0E8_9NEOP|nr:hypothetical protein K1T71_007224 [Dendrolimus kikuchii]